MKIGLIGVGTVGGTLKKYFEEKTNHEIVCYDPGKGMNDDFAGIDCAFISVPVPPSRGSETGQDLSLLTQSVHYAKKFTDTVFVRSTVLPGTNDKLRTIACPEFLTERRAFDDMCSLPVLFGSGNKIIYEIFPDKEVIWCSNKEAELAKFTHNCFGAMKVTYFNIINQICESIGARYNVVKNVANITGFLGDEHRQVPGPDGKLGYGGKCFPENIEAMSQFISRMYPDGTTGVHESMENFISNIDTLNYYFRIHPEIGIEKVITEASL